MSGEDILRFHIKQLEKKKNNYNSDSEIHNKMMEQLDKKISVLRSCIIN